MLKSVLFSLVAFAAVKANAQSCYIPQLNDFAAYTINSMDVRHSDHQGFSGAGGNLLASEFLFEGNPDVCMAVAAGGVFDFQFGSTEKDVEAGSARLRNVAIKNGSQRGTVFTVYGVDASRGNSSYRQQRRNPLFTNFAGIASELTQRSAGMDMLPDTMKAEDFGAFYLTLKPGQNVVSIDAVKLMARPHVIIEGSSDAVVVINVRGPAIKLDGWNVDLRGSMSMKNIHWNFPDARTLDIVRTANASYGIPGRVYAPCAVTEFYDGLITGSIWVKEIIFNPARGFQNSGQINRIVEKDCACK